MLKLFGKIKNALYVLFSYESSPKKLAFACSLAIYIAFSPFFGFHTMMLIAAGMIFKLNVPLLLLLGYTINNPFTMLPIYLSGYLLGYWILHTWLQIPLDTANPWWLDNINHYLQAHIGHSNISLWGFMLGGNILGIALALIFYPILLYTFRRVAYTQQ